MPTAFSVQLRDSSSVFVMNAMRRDATLKRLRKQWAPAKERYAYLKSKCNFNSKQISIWASSKTEIISYDEILNDE